MASTSSINSGGSHHVPNPPPRTHSRPNQPPPPPPLPSVPPVPPTRDSSIAISKATMGNQNTPIPPFPPSSTGMSHSRTSQQSARSSTDVTLATTTAQSSTLESGFLAQFECYFRPLDDLPPPEPFMNKHKTYSSQKALEKQSIASKTIS